MISIRNATAEDMDEIMRVEQSWPEDARAPADAMLVRIEKFAKGFFLAIERDEDGAELVVATITTMPMYFTDGSIHEFTSWDEVTDNGYLRDYDMQRCNTLYIVSGVIDSNYRGGNIFTPMVLREVELAAGLGLRYVLAGAVMPGYRKYVDKHGPVPAYDYTRLRRGKHLVDPLLAMYEAIDFHVPNPHHVLQEYYPDDASKNYAALVMRDLEASPFKPEQG